MRCMQQIVFKSIFIFIFFLTSTNSSNINNNNNHWKKYIETLILLCVTFPIYWSCDWSNIAVDTELVTAHDGANQVWRMAQ